MRSAVRARNNAGRFVWRSLTERPIGAPCALTHSIWRPWIAASTKTMSAPTATHRTPINLGLAGTTSGTARQPREAPRAMAREAAGRGHASFSGSNAKIWNFPNGTRTGCSKAYAAWGRRSGTEHPRRTFEEERLADLLAEGTRLQQLRCVLRTLAVRRFPLHQPAQACTTTSNARSWCPMGHRALLFCSTRGGFRMPHAPVRSGGNARIQGLRATMCSRKQKRCWLLASERVQGWEGWRARRTRQSTPKALTAYRCARNHA